MRGSGVGLTNQTVNLAHNYQNKPQTSNYSKSRRSNNLTESVLNKPIQKERPRELKPLTDKKIASVNMSSIYSQKVREHSSTVVGA